MGKYYLFIVLLAVALIILVGLAVKEVGTPISAAALAQDAARISDFSNIKRAIDLTYIDNNTLPRSLNELSRYLAKVPTDPVTKQEYTYEVVDSDTYKLCATFSTDTKNNEKVDPYSIGTYDGSNQQHAKGYDCIEYNVRTTPMYRAPTIPIITTPQPTSTPSGALNY